ncbi:NADH-quinone oxidoreductase subunit N [Buchnera aphidicola (Cinara piceae)]|uniref:NADH-quinone oxidoreductase subunit N n=1 Tax=Buchnera aphidicola (Cinara piceae) TaxID=1660043 RepID=A0A803FTK3_9GAMM|nr:proton-conducting transporter membrane subunit [Buchnera aphidicola]VFP88074.1 NADH-quinone oxidoreductase subunit N [Buchnera aphidicola (Cinara piceae)]
MIRLFYSIIPILPILILISSILIILFVSFYKKKTYLGCMIIIFSIFFSIISIIYSKYFMLEYFSELIKIDKYSYFFIFMLLISSFYTCAFSYNWLSYGNYHSIEFYLFLLLSVLGGILVSISNHFSTLFIGSELLFLPLLGILMFFPKAGSNLLLIVIYMIMSIFSSSFLLLGCSFIYFISGRLCFSFFSQIFIYHPSIMFGSIILFGFSIVFLSLFFKLSLFPLHTWSPGIYQNTNSCSLIYFSTVTRISIFSFLIRFFYYIPYIYNIKLLYFIIYYISVLSIFFGNLFSIFQNKVQRSIGYLSISNLGFLLMLLLIYSSKEDIFIIRQIQFYLFGYILGLVGFFSIKSTIDFNIFSKKIYSIKDNSLRGLFWYDPILGISISLILLSLSGFPLTLGFWGKFFIFKNLIQRRFFITVIIMMLSSIIGMQSYLNIIYNVYDTSLTLDHTNIKYNFYIPLFQKYLILFMSLVFIILGFFPQIILNIL